jgi:putative ABC transport system permease protein
VLQQGASLAVAGAVVGACGALLLRKVLAGSMYGLSANDPVTLCLVPCMMVLVMLLGCWIPARTAAKINPMVALRDGE